ncbi:ParB/RepB/Spo0J family partition protein [Paenibacillus melissococcoides]|uniref:ParB/RepB/Spo0J family partition protein n=1 Tax=Paenibacillus melissococcoides TaxID=2912268 RepID=A0ABM9G8D8_9BACL|nr:MULTISPECIES: ParB/RepB/Spo0J family partition protein [Paenibacillus]MEB9897124.1 ParB/RepB/Spo0J family partition protein [Bacillus cereus]CAH8248210.1 ParB/RepB/Spo0J family partition protein [Paenibacillus melissococcoides]CAH8718152.1 ParB/RepB/Spo0J family partition protein [Paenibacillus melissococcoides]CAH8718970.1 ParB/RepB/Spo0J family partition protein [Paenibacillus melissococcoides]GIO82352.1 hypothetical protein J6TS7_59620 [Paenibacillus dendritiformis]
MSQTHEIRKVDDLLPHPLYPLYYPEIVNVTIQRFITLFQQSNYISPIIVTEENVIPDGHHRHLAAKRMGIETVPVTVKKVTEKEAIILLTTYNCARNNITEELLFLAKRIKAALDYHDIKPGPRNCPEGTNVTAKDIAKMFNIAPRTMYRYLSLLEVIPELQYKHKINEVGIKSIEKIANTLDEEQQKNCIYKLLTVNWMKLR